MNKSVLASAAVSILAARAFASGNATAATSTAPVLTGVSSAVAMPSRTTKRGSVSIYPFDQLTTTGMSFGVKNKTAKQLSSIVSNANRKAIKDKTDASGAVVFKTTEVKDANGTVIGQAPTTNPEKVITAHYFAADVDPKGDPDGASVRIFRDK